MSLVILFLKYIIHMNDKFFYFIAPESGALLKTSVQRSNPIQPNPPRFERSKPFYGDLKQTKAYPLDESG